ncbi:MAG: NAD(P)-dependent oxidoreductase [Bacilli bacterium]|nr:NAD(P)-dependent oxidoreductase [Bacilli bacterium]
MKIIIAGINGFIGRSVAKYCAEKGVEIVGIDLQDSVAPCLKPFPNIEYHILPKQGYSSLEKEIPISSIFCFINFAWIGVSQNNRDKLHTQIGNLNSYLDSYELANKLCIPRYLCPGSVTELELLKNVYLNESNLKYNNVAYSISKVLSRCVMQELSLSNFTKVVWAVLPNVYGPTDMSNRFLTFSLRQMLMGKDLELTKCEQLVDFVNISDVANAFYLLATRDLHYNNYFVGSGKPLVLKQALLTISNLINYKGSLKFATVPFEGVSLNPECFSIERIKQDIGYIPAISFEKGVQELIGYLINEKTS